MIVVDTNILAYFWIPGPMTEFAERLVQKDAEWKVPPLWRSEFSNVIGLHIKFRKISLHDGLAVLHKSIERLQKHEYPVNPLKVLELSAVSGCTSYDCEFVSLAKALDVPFVTTDTLVLKAFPKIAIHLKKFLE